MNLKNKFISNVLVMFSQTKLSVLTLSFIFFSSNIFAVSNSFESQTTELKVDPRVKIVTMTAAYGAVGGAIVGLASNAFGAKPRNISIGASLGLYAGIGIGLFIVFSPKTYHEKPSDEDYDSIHRKRGFLEMDKDKNFALSMPEINFSDKNLEANLLTLNF